MTFEIIDNELAELIVDRVLSRLSHINPAVVLASIKVLLKFTVILKNDKITEGVCNKISSPLITLLNMNSECVWVLLRNVQVLIEKFPKLIKSVKVFFVKYNDPSYVKLEKLKLITKLCDETNYKMIINELVEYTYDPNIEFSRKAVKALWSLSLTLQGASESCLKAIHQILVNSNQNGFADHLINELAIGLNFIYRKHLSIEKLKNSFQILIDNYVRINEDEAVINFLDMLPNFADLIKDKKELVSTYNDAFLSSSLSVQYTILTAMVKLYVLKPNEFTDEVINTLQLAADEVANGDLRDRAFFYWRLLDVSPIAAKKIIFAQRKSIKGGLNEERIPNDKIDSYFKEIGSIKTTLQQDSVMCETTPLVVKDIEKGKPESKPEATDDFIGIDIGSEPTTVNKQGNKDDLLGIFDNDVKQQNIPEIKPVVKEQSKAANDLDLFDINMGEEKKEENKLDLLDQFETKEQVKEQPVTKQVNSTNDVNKYDDLNIFSMNAKKQLDDQKKNKQEPVKQETNDQTFNFDILEQPKPTQSKKKAKRIDFIENEESLLLSSSSLGIQGKSGIEIRGRLLASDEGLDFHFIVKNTTNSPISFMKFKLLPNLFSFEIENSVCREEIRTGESKTIVCSIYPEENTSTDWKKAKNHSFKVNMVCEIDEFNFTVDSHVNSLMVS